MYDSINFRIRQDEAGGVDFLAETSCFLENIAEHHYSGDTVITGNLGGLKISLNRYQLKVKDGSICKWFLGDNFRVMGRGDTERAIEKLSDMLHLPMSKATVTRLDAAQNFVLKHPPEVYLNHLGLLRYHKRCSMVELGSLYYHKGEQKLVFYDKNREQRSKGEPIPDLYQGKNLLRYELRYTGRVATALNVPEVTGAILYNEAFYIGLLDRWKDTYKAIQKINDVSLNFGAMKTKQQLYKMGVLSLIEQAGGQLQMLEQINEAQKRGELTGKQAFDLRAAVKDACKLKEGLTVPNEAIEELNKKVGEAVRFYR